jgi:hypothetical protein
MRDAIPLIDGAFTLRMRSVPSGDSRSDFPGIIAFPAGMRFAILALVTTAPAGTGFANAIKAAVTTIAPVGMPILTRLSFTHIGCLL